MSSSLVIGCVGKPSSGKSTFLNAATDAKAKMGNFPFTTIEANKGVGFYTIDCPCGRHNVSSSCRPRYGVCHNSRRTIPVQMLDVAGLVPGAAEGLGLGNKFLDDVRHANILLHIVDVSGTTNEKGENCVGYDPTRDVEWLQKEIHEWIHGNLWKKWGSILRRHIASRHTLSETLVNHLSGYEVKAGHVSTIAARCASELPDDLSMWSEADVHRLVDITLDVRFKTVVVMNKIDSPDASRNIQRIASKYPEHPSVLCSALSELLLRKLNNQGIISYNPLEDAGDFVTSYDEPDAGSKQHKPPLKMPDEKTRKRLEHVRDLVLFRYGSTGVQDAMNTAIESLGYYPVFFVKNFTSFTDGSPGSGAFRDCALIAPGTTVRDVAERWGGAGIERDGIQYLHSEGLDGRRLADDEPLSPAQNIIRFCYGVPTVKEAAAQDKPPVVVASTGGPGKLIAGGAHGQRKDNKDSKGTKTNKAKEKGSCCDG